MRVQESGYQHSSDSPTVFPRTYLIGRESNDDFFPGFPTILFFVHATSVGNFPSVYRWKCQWSNFPAVHIVLYVPTVLTFFHIPHTVYPYRYYFVQTCTWRQDSRRHNSAVFLVKRRRANIAMDVLVAPIGWNVGTT